MDQPTFILIGIAVVVLAGLALIAFRYWRSKQGEDERTDFLCDLIELVLDTLVKETKQELADIPLSEVEEIARAVYDKVIAPTPIAPFIPRETFVQLVVDEWRRVVGVQTLVAQTVMRNRSLDRMSRRGGPALPVE